MDLDDNLTYNGSFRKIVSSKNYVYLVYKHDLIDFYSGNNSNSLEVLMNHFRKSILIFDKNLKYLGEVEIPKEYGTLCHVTKDDLFYFSTRSNYIEDDEFEYNYISKITFY